jgi:predicted nucleotidyltransferase
MVPPTPRPDILRNRNLSRSLNIFFTKMQEILLAFLFGSVASKRMGPSSDVDLGILFKTVPDIDAINGVAEELSSIFQREVDLAVLNHASPVLRMQVLKNGILLYASHMKHFHRFFTDTINQYDDLKRIRKKCEEDILKGRIYAR